MRICSTSRHRATSLLSLIIGVLAICATSAPVIAQRPTSARITSSFDRDWLFLKGDAPGAEKSEFSDAAWRKLDAPHDWSIEGPVDEKNPSGRGGGFMSSGIGWYDKGKIKLTATSPNLKSASIEIAVARASRP